MGKKDKIDEKEVLELMENDEDYKKTVEELHKKVEDFMKKYDKPIKINKIKPSDIKKF